MTGRRVPRISGVPSTFATTARGFLDHKLIPCLPSLCARLACGLVAIGLATAAARADIAGTATIVDGDTIIVGGVVLHLYGIDAVEHDQLCMHRGKPWTCGLRAKALLKEFVGRNTVRCRIMSEDLDGRRYALCRVHDLDLGAEMAMQGYAFNLPRYARRYHRQIGEARQRSAGIWDSIYVDPREWRMWKR